MTKSKFDPIPLVRTRKGCFYFSGARQTRAPRDFYRSINFPHILNLKRRNLKSSNNFTLQAPLAKLHAGTLQNRTNRRKETKTKVKIKIKTRVNRSQKNNSKASRSRTNKASLNRIDLLKPNLKRQHQTSTPHNNNFNQKSQSNLRTSIPTWSNESFNLLEVMLSSGKMSSSVPPIRDQMPSSTRKLVFCASITARSTAIHSQVSFRCLQV